MKSTIFMLLALLSGVGQSQEEDFDFDRKGGAPQIATARLSPPLGGPGITARLTLVDTGRQLQVFGSGRGFDPNQHYDTLIYDADAQPSGARACIPSGTAAVPLSTFQMQIGSWQPIGTNARNLLGVRKGPAYVPLANIGVISVRQRNQVGATVTLVLQSCGDVVPR